MDSLPVSDTIAPASPSTPSAAQARSARAPRRWFSWRAVVLLGVYFTGLLGFVLGAGVAERPQLVQLGLLAKVYHALGLFVLAGIDLGMPTGGPGYARALLWFAYFAAPAVTAGALTEGFLRAINADAWALRRMRGHVVIGGCGRLAMVYLARLREMRPRLPVVMVEARGENANTAAARARGARVIAGDISDEATLAALRLHRASRVLLLTGNDFANLDAAARILASSPQAGARTVVHVSDLRFARVLAGTHVARDCVVFNSHQVAAQGLVATTLRKHFERSDGPDTVVLAGFGRFGQTVLAELQRTAADLIDTVVIIDTDARRNAAVFGEQVGFAAGFSREVFDGNLQDPEVWARVHAICASRSTVFVVGSGEDGTNLRTAVWLTGAYPGALVVARTFASSWFAQQLARERGFVTFSVADLVARSIPEDWLG